MSTTDAALVSRLPHSALTPVFAGLQIALHLMILGLTGFVIVRAAFGIWPYPGAVVTLAAVFLGTYIGGSYLSSARSSTARSTPRWVVPVWVIILMLEWLLLTLLVSDAAYIVFPLFFLQLNVLPLRWAIPSVGVSVLLAIWALTWHIGWNLGATLGPLIGAGAAIAVGLGYRALLAEAAERQALITDLIETRAELAAAARAAGTISERERLAREIHDTVAQGLSSIQMLLHATERTVTDPTALEHLRLARETAALNLQETRRFIRELTPPALEAQTLPAALERLAETASASAGPLGSPDASVGRAAVTVHVTGDPVPLPMRLEATLLRIAQGSLANVAQHANASRAELTLSYMPNAIALDIVDNGAGFDPAATTAAGRADSFGLQAIRARVEQLGGTFVLESAPGSGTAIAVTFPLNTSPDNSTSEVQA
ncbi:sensor histidine kinase [Leifsonia sp. A12D58]|uniref:sensor histidine kinase n=1 Tax=Leifsonia sp. A12D58 TaxID=3397674 RepID=UPI0039E17B5A